MTDGSIVPSKVDVTEDDFRILTALGLSRAEKALGGRRQLAAIMDLSTKQVGNIMRGGSTDPKRLFDVNAEVPGTLDDVATAYGLRLVPMDAVCSTDGARSSGAIVSLLAKVIEAEADGRIDHTERFGMEGDLRAVRAFIDRELAKIAADRRPTVVAA